MIQEIFGIKIWYGKVDGWEELDQKLKSDDLKKYTKSTKEKSSRNYSWGSNVHTGLNENLLIPRPQWIRFLNDKVDKHIKSYKKTVCVDETVETYYQEPWVNYYESNEFQEYHDHVGNFAVFSYCYFHEIPENSGDFVLLNPIGNFVDNSAYKFTEKLHTITPEKGDLIIFPSWLSHMVTPNRSSEARISISGNLHYRN